MRRSAPGPSAISLGSGALDRLHRLTRQRPVLRGGVEAALARHKAASPAALEAWATAILRLADVNAGPVALLAACRLAARPVRDRRDSGLAGATEAAEAAAALCRRAGAAAARDALDACSALDARFAGSADAASWWRTLVRLAHEEPEAVSAAAGISARVIAACGTAGFETFVGAALRATLDRAGRLAFLRLDDKAARRLLDRLGGDIDLEARRRDLQVFSRALWGQTLDLVGAASSDPERPRRTTLLPGKIYLPEALPGVPRNHVPSLYRAMVAHAGAHLVLGSPRRAPGTLKPLQVTLVGLIEDARIEMLAMRRFPGLRRLWAPFHTASPSPFKTAPLILARLAYGLFDPTYEDDDALLAKARALFAAEPDLEDPALSRRIGSILGHDMGQMRIPFDAKGFVIEPAYRDDNLGLWQLPLPPPDAARAMLDLAVDAVRLEHRPDETGTAATGDTREAGAGRARVVAPADDGIVVAHYPEWDRGAGFERPDWTTIREVVPPVAPATSLLARIDADPPLRRRIERLVRGAGIGRPLRLKRQPDGTDLDLDAAIDAMRALRAGETPDDRVHQRKVVRTQDIATILLIDASESTRDRVPTLGTRIIDVETHAVALLAGAMEAAGHRFAVRAFASDTRAKVRYSCVKDMEARFDATALGRMAGLEPGLSTRLGAALRHAGHELADVAASRRVILVLGDGAPSDIDVADPLDLTEDARRAVLGLRAGGIDTFGLTLDPAGAGAGSDIFGRHHHMPVQRIEDLPRRLAALYFRLARR